MEIKPLHVALGAIGVGVIFYAFKQSQAAQLTVGPTVVVPPAKSGDVIATKEGPVVNPVTYDISKTAQFVLDVEGKTATVKPGQMIHFTKNVGGPAWAGDGVISSNPTVVMPVANTIADFVAKAEGAAVITGYYFADDGSGLQKLTATIMVSAA